MRLRKYFNYIGFACIFGLTLFSFNGCNLVRKTVGSKKVSSAEESIVRKVINSQEEVKFTEIRVTGRADEDGKKVGFMGTVRIEKDKQIFIILRSTIGIELGRVYANRDSVWIISKMLNIKEKGEWKLADAQIGYPVDFYALQGIFLQTLFTSTGDDLSNLIDNLVAKDNKEDLHLVSKTDVLSEKQNINYFTDFVIDKNSYIILDSKIRDIHGQWIADVKYIYNKENIIKKIELKGIDSERNFAVDLNIVKRDNKDFIDINFDKF